jgi:predicted Zn-dependent peptidase
VFERSVLDNGLRVLTAPMPHTRSVSISVYVGAGSRYELKGEEGQSHMLEHMLFKGTAKRPTAREISEQIDGIGGNHNAATDRELTVYYTKVPSHHFLLGLDILADMMLAPVMDRVEFEKERKVVLEELAMVADQPAQLVDLLVDEVMWPDQAMGRDIAGTPESVEGLTVEGAAAYFHRQYVPNNAVVSIAGNVTHAEVMCEVDRLLGKWEPGEPGPWEPAVDGQEGLRQAVRFKRTEQAHISLAVPGLAALHPQRQALDLLSTVLGEGMSSRLWMELREHRGLAYDVHSYASHFRDTGAFVTYIGVDPRNARQAVNAMSTELARLKEGVSEEELNKGREIAKGRLLLRMEDTRSVSGWLGAQEMLLDEVRTADQAVEEVDAVTAEEVSSVAASLIRADRLNLAAVGPFKSSQRLASALAL